MDICVCVAVAALLSCSYLDADQHNQDRAVFPTADFSLETCHPELNSQANLGGHPNLQLSNSKHGSAVEAQVKKGASGHCKKQQLQSYGNEKEAEVGKHDLSVVEESGLARPHNEMLSWEVSGGAVTKNKVKQYLAFVSSWYPFSRPTRSSLRQVFNFFQPVYDGGAASE